MKHNYPKNRKPNPNSITQILLKKYSEQELYKMWVKFNDMYKMSDYLYLLGHKPLGSLTAHYTKFDPAKLHKTVSILDQFVEDI